MPRGLERIELLLSRPRVHMKGLEHATAEVIADSTAKGTPNLAQAALNRLKRDNRSAAVSFAVLTLQAHLARVRLSESGASTRVVEVEDSVPQEGGIELPELTPVRIELCTEASEELLARLAEHPEDRFRLDARVFEMTVAELLDRMGWEVRLTPRSGDKGRDILAESRLEPVPLLMLVECKRYSEARPVGPEPITRLWYRLDADRANVGMVVTTSTFAPVAERVARDRRYEIALRKGDDYIAWIRQLLDRNRGA